jgi:hypothetical protein
VIERIAAHLRGVDEHLEIGPRLPLPHELVEGERAQGSVGVVLSLLRRDQAAGIVQANILGKSLI